jgi:bifunctional DNA-binding transcriptional regulator/antitoxin component of YhaV-PrlF toxin-antitoxin module
MRATAVISSKGQIVIPANLRKRYGMNVETTVVFQENHGTRQSLPAISTLS